MKKVLFCASLAMLAVGCAQDDFESLEAQQGAKGISFEAGLSEAASTRGDLVYDATENVHKFFWYAEQDQISIWSTWTSGTSGGNDDGNFDATKKATYKATQSKANGVFTAVSAADILNFAHATTDNDYVNGTAAEREAYKSQFVAVYPSSVTATVSGNVFTLASLPTLSDQNQKTADGQDVTKKLLMYSTTKAIKTNAYDAVGEKIALNFVRPYTALVMNIKGVNDYALDFGELKTITVTMKGYTPEGGSLEIPASIIDYGSDATYKLDPANAANNSLNNPAGTGDASSITLKMGVVTPATPAVGTPEGPSYTPATSESIAGISWRDNYNAYMAIHNVTRDGVFTSAKPETYEVEYKFANITFTKSLTTSKDWKANGSNNFYQIADLNIADYDYLVTDGTGGSNRTLIVNKGSLAAVFNEAGTSVEWNGSGIAPTAFSKVVCKTAMSEADYAKLSKFTNATSLELTEAVELPKNLLKDGSAAFTAIKLPKVTKIGENAFKAQTALQILYMGAYNFSDSETVNALFFNGSTQSTLAYLDMSGVSTMTPTFGVERELSFAGYSKLTTVWVKNGVQLSSNAFAKCKALKNVIGTVKIDGAVNAFAMENNTGEENDQLATINIDGTSIPASAFKNCTVLEKVLKSGVQVAPTSVGENAFENCAAMTYMNLGNVATLGKEAFINSGLISNNKDSKVLTVGAATISKGAFYGTSVRMVDFTQATTLEPEVFGTVTTLIQVRFNKPFTGKVADGATDWDYTFGNTTNKYMNTVLFVAEGQEHVESNKLGLPYKSSDDVLYVNHTFKGIYKN